MVPCSLAAHVYRHVIWSKKLAKQKYSNEYRLAEVWMDDYKNDVFEMKGNHSVRFIYYCFN